MTDPNSKVSSEEIPPILKYTGIALVFYLSLCIFYWLAWDPEEARLVMINKCGADSQFCQCQADRGLAQMGFLKMPLIQFGLVEIDRSTMGPACRIYLR